MKNHTPLTLGVLFSFFLVNAVQAATIIPLKPKSNGSAPAQSKSNTSVSAKSADAPLTSYEEAPWYLFLGADLGGSRYSSFNDSGTEAPRTGTHLGGRILAARYFESIVADGGVGINLISNKGTNSDGTINNDTTKNGYGDFSIRYRFGKHWQFGPEFQYWFGSDYGLNPTVTGTDKISGDENTSMWGGAQLMYEMTTEHKVRLGGRYLTDLNVAGRSVGIYQAFIQIGFDVFSASRSEERPRHIEQVTEEDLDRAAAKATEEPLPMATPEPTPELPPADAYESQSDPLPMSTPASPEPEPTPEMGAPAEPVPMTEKDLELEEAKSPKKVVITLDVNDLPFGFDNADLPKANAARLKKMGASLKANQSAWGKLSITGHTDERGTKEYNQALSQKRANTVKSYLVAGGVPAKKITAKGLGETRPKDKRHNEKAYAKNRRVELEFLGVKNAASIKKAMK